jgi:hypothetical protein
MTLRPLFALFLAINALLTAAATADETTTPSRIDQLIRNLASNEYTLREAATEELARIGLPAYTALDAAAKHPDREVRYRSRRVLGIIRHYDQERRLQAFLSGQDTAPPLAGWQRFRKTYGDGGEQRRLFVEMQRADPQLLMALDEAPRAAADLLAERLVVSQQARPTAPEQITFGQVAAAFFVAAEADVTLDSQPLASLFSLCYQPSVREVLDGAARRELPRKMLGSIISRCEGLDAFQAMNVARQFEMPEGLVAATSILKGQETRRMAPIVQHALITIAKLGDASHLPLVDTPLLLTDVTSVTQFKEGETTYVIQLRDVALATAILLSKQDLKSYFGPAATEAAGDPQNIFLNARVIGFATEDERAAVFAKWSRSKRPLEQ